MLDLKDEEFLLVASDIHDSESVLSALSKKASTPKCLGFLYAGDLNIENLLISQQIEYSAFPFLAVQGNCDNPWSWSDIGITLPSYRSYECKGLRIFLSHGHRFSAPSDVGLSDKDFDIVITGHTHMNELSEHCIDEKRVLFLNPGSPTRPRGGTKGSYALIRFQKKDSVCVEIRSLNGDGLLAQKHITVHQSTERND